MTAAGSKTGAVQLGGRGTFDGVMTKSFKDPRIAGRFSGDAIQAFYTTWGRVSGDAVIENRYIDVTNGVIGDEPEKASIRTSGRYSLGYPRADGLEEVRAHIAIRNWPLGDLQARLRHGRLAGRRDHRVGGHGHQRALHRVVRVGPHAARRRRGLEGALRVGIGRSHAHGHRHQHRPHRDGEGHRPDDRRGRRQVGRHVFVRRARRSGQGRVARQLQGRAGAAHRIAGVHGLGRGRVHVAALRVRRDDQGSLRRG